MNVSGIALFRDEQPAGRSQSVEKLRKKASFLFVSYFWVATAAVCLAAALSGASLLAVMPPLCAIGIITTGLVLRDPTALSTRLVVTVAINSTWMFGLYVAAGIHAGAYMLEVHMLYFINGSVILAYVCWRSVLMTTVAALLHHLVLSLFEPALVWPQDNHAWFHFMNHSVLGGANCLVGIFAAIYFKRFLERMEQATHQEKYRSRHDTLTGLLNRRGLQNAVDKMISASSGSPKFTLFQIDLDNFKQVNDGLGHAAGDALLVKVSRALEECSPEGALIARVGGDEYVVVIAGMDRAVCDSFLADFQNFASEPLLLYDRQIHFGASIGITDTNVSGRDFASMLIDGDLALYEAKRVGKNCSFMFSKTLRATSIRKRKLEENVLRAMENDEFEPFFQTQHEALTGAITGVEVLARWRHPLFSVIGPGEFLPALADLGKMATFDRLIFDKTVLLLADLEREGFSIPKVGINVSYDRLLDGALKENIASLPKLQTNLAFEIVESVIFDDFSEDEISTIAFLRENGIGIELDDFGTGRASITALTSVRPDLIKIDRTLIAPLSESPDQYSLIKSIVDMAHGLGIKALAEGVEQPHEIARLRTLNIDSFQGFAYSKPMAFADFKTFLERSRFALADVEAAPAE